MKIESLEDVFVKVLELAHVRGLRDLEKVPGCFELQVNSEWAIVFNPHKIPIMLPNGVDLPAWHMVIEKQGDFLGIVNPVEIDIHPASAREEFLTVLNEQINLSELPNIGSEFKSKYKTESEENDYSKMH
ncbi:MAG: hypothetical protein COB04_19610 [Gammaproteobacteria bacterium]|nr:MAG: hypothetical protein COB04_19610 [Gammaproteobacteria bacterium]